jgi:hypothetical protein
VLRLGGEVAPLRLATAPTGAASPTMDRRPRRVRRLVDVTLAELLELWAEVSAVMEAPRRNGPSAGIASDPAATFQRPWMISRTAIASAPLILLAARSSIASSRSLAACELAGRRGRARDVWALHD